MTKKMFDPITHPIVTTIGNRSCIIIGDPVRNPIYVDDLTKEEIVDIENEIPKFVLGIFNPVRFEDYILCRFIRSQHGVVDGRQIKESLYHTYAGAASLQAANYLKRLGEMTKIDPDSPILDQGVNRAISYLKSCGLVDDHGFDSWSLTKVGAVLQSIRNGWGEIIEI